MKEFKDLQELIIKAEEIALRLEDVNEEQDRMRLALNKVTNDTRQAVIRMGNMIEMIPKIEKNVDIITNKVNSISADKIRKDFDDSLSGINIEFDWTEINKSMNLRLIKCFQDMHLNKFAKHVDSHIDNYNDRCKEIDTSINKLQTINNISNRLGKQILSFEHMISKWQTNKSYFYWPILVSLGVFIGSIITYIIMKF